VDLKNTLSPMKSKILQFEKIPKKEKKSPKNLLNIAKNPLKIP